MRRSRLATSVVPLIICTLLVSLDHCRCERETAVVAAKIATTSGKPYENEQDSESALAKLVKIFSKPGAFGRVNAILGENSIEESTSCPKGNEGLDCRRAEARRSVDCPHGDCYCYNCASAGPEMWAPCCRESLRCCSHLAAACRNCDHPSLYPFCTKHFKKCIDQGQRDDQHETEPPEQR